MLCFNAEMASGARLLENLVIFYVIRTNVLNNGRGFGRGRVKVVTFSAVKQGLLQIAVVAV